MNNGQDDRNQNQNPYRGQTDWNEYYRARGFEKKPPEAPAKNDPAGDSALILGVIALVGLSFCRIASIVCGIIAMCRARDSRMMLRFETGSAKAGRICGLIAIILSVFIIFGVIFAIIFTVILGFGFLYPFIAFYEYVT